jgi:uncharacterized membrane protein SpoIIM required for sporulation/ABC-type transport system involved in multi-copper enzyme maturation permease subunit
MTLVGSFPSTATGAWVVARREIKDQLRDWRILSPILILTLFFPLLMNFTAEQAVGFVGRYGAPIIGDRLIPFLLMVVGFFPISISLVIALESFAGERERRSLEPLLATPLTDGQLFIGKMFASLLLPVLAAYIGILVYLIGLYLRLEWIPPVPLLVQVVLLTTAQAFVMVCGAVVISSQTTSVRAANLLASFVILPVSQLIIGESLIMFWGRYNILWLIVLFLFIIAIVLSRMGLHLFNRESLLGREIDVLNFRWLLKIFWKTFKGNSSNFFDWYRGIWKISFPLLKKPIFMISLVFVGGFLVGTSLAGRFQLPLDLLELDRIDEILAGQLSQLGLMNFRGWLWILSNNVRAILLAAFLGIFSFGIVGSLLLMTPIAIIGYLAGNLALAGHDAILFLTALVLPHSLFEVPAAIISGGAILKLGMVFISPPEGLSLGESWVQQFAQWARISIGIVLPLLILGAFIEAFLTPKIALILLTG